MKKYIICTKCKKEKTSKDFFKDNKKKNGLRSSCKECIREDNRIRNRHNFITNKNNIQEKTKIYRKERLEKMTENEKLLYNLNRRKNSRKLTSEENTNIYQKRKYYYLKKYGFSYTHSRLFGIDKLKILYNKSNGKCNDCGKNRKLIVHHIDGNGFGKYKKHGIEPNNDISNLVILCRKCHMLIHKNLPILRS